MLYLLGGIAAALTCFMFLTRQSLLGFPAMIFWLLFGGYCISVAPAISFADVYFLTGFASILGMGFLTGFGAYGMREIKTENKDTDEFIDEAGGADIDDIGEPVPEPEFRIGGERQRKGVKTPRQRAEERRARVGG